MLAVSRLIPRRRGPALAAALTAALVACAPASAQSSAAARAGGASTGWSTFGFDAQRTGFNPAEARLGVDNVPRLRQIWSADLGGVSDTQPVFVPGGGRPGDLVLAGSEHGDLRAFAAASGRPIWSRSLGAYTAPCADTPGGVFGVTGTPVVDRTAHTVYATDGLNRVHALDLATGRERRGWPVTITPQVSQHHVWGALTLVGGRLYVGVSSYCDQDLFRGRISALDVVRAQVVATWLPTGRHGYGGGVWGWGGVSIDPRDASVYTTVGNAQPGPENAGYGEHLVRLDRDLHVMASNFPGLPTHGDVDFGAAPMLYRAAGCPPQLLVLHKTGVLFVYDRDRIARGPRQRIQIGRRGLPYGFGTYAYWPPGRTVFVSNNSDANDGTYGHGLLAFTVGRTCALRLRWQRTIDPNPNVISAPVVANGVVYVAGGRSPSASAYDARTGRTVWRSRRDAISEAAYGAPSVAGGRLFVAAWDKRLHAFAPGP